MIFNYSSVVKLKEKEKSVDVDLSLGLGSIYWRRFPSSQTVKINQSVILKCEGESSEPLQYYWWDRFLYLMKKVIVRLGWKTIFHCLKRHSLKIVFEHSVMEFSPFIMFNRQITVLMSVWSVQHKARVCEVNQRKSQWNVSCVCRSSRNVIRSFD